MYLPGYVEDTAAAYHVADLFVFPSKREGMPVALMEAMAAGLPVIVSDIRGNAELVDEKGGYLFRVDDMQAFTAAVRRLIGQLKETPRQAQRMGRHNQHKVMKYDSVHVNARMKKIYMEMLRQG